MFKQQIIDPFLVTDPSQPGNGVITVGDPFPLQVAICISAALIIVALIRFFWRTSELHESVFHSTIRMSRRDTQKALGSTAYSLGERAQRIAEQASDEVMKAVMGEAHETLRVFGARRTVHQIEIPMMLSEIMDIYRRIPRSSPLKEGEKSARFNNCLKIFADLVSGATGNLDEQRAIDSHMNRCVQVAHRMHATVSEEAIIKVLEKTYLRLLEAKERYIAAGPRPKKVKRADTDPPPKASALTELLFVIINTEEALGALPAKVDLQDRTQIELFRKDLHEWIELALSLAYADGWNVEACAWFLFGYLGRLGASFFVGSRN